MRQRIGPLVVYHSKTGNTRRIAEAIADVLGAEALPLSLMKTGRRTKAERDADRELFEAAMRRAQDAPLVVIGTPTEFRKPHPRALAFVEAVQAKRVAVFCTYYGMLGATLIDMEATLRQRRILLAGILQVRVGTAQYRFRRNPGEYVDQVTPDHLSKAAEFARDCVSRKKPLAPRLHGVCGRDCRKCPLYGERHCEGAASRCWSGNGCGVFACCTIKHSLAGCDRCVDFAICSKLESIRGRFPGCNSA